MKRLTGNSEIVVGFAHCDRHYTFSSWITQPCDAHSLLETTGTGVCIVVYKQGKWAGMQDFACVLDYKVTKYISALECSST